MPEDTELRTKIKGVYTQALTNEYAAILLVHIAACSEDKINLRKAVAGSLKVMTTELNHVLDSTEQTCKCQSLFHSSLQARVTSALKME